MANTHPGWDVFRTVNEFVRFSDTKAAIILAFAGGSAAFLSARADILHDIIRAHKVDGWGLTLYFAILVYLFALFFTVLAALRSVWPALGGVEEERSLIFFRHIAEDFKGKHREYAKALGDLDDQSLAGQLAQQICANAAIATNKFHLVARAVRGLVVALSAWALIMILLLLIGPAVSAG